MNITENKPKDKVVACLLCSINHRKCDGNRPCSSCVIKNVECVENKKRKAPGRPKLSPEEKKERKMQKRMQNKAKKEEFKSQITCQSCNKTQDGTAKFCNQCGSKLPESAEERHFELMRELEMEKRKAENLQKIIKIKESTNDLWAILKIAFPPNSRPTYPAPGYIMETSPAMRELLGHKNMVNMFSLDTVAPHHIKYLDQSNAIIKLERINGLTTPYLIIRNHNSYIKHSQGHYVQVMSNLTVYFQVENRQPTFAFIKHKLVKPFVHSEDVPECLTPEDVTYYCNESETLHPELVKLLCPELKSGTKNPTLFDYFDHSSQPYQHELHDYVYDTNTGEVNKNYGCYSYNQNDY